MNTRKLKKYWHKVLPNTKKIPKRLSRFSMKDKKLECRQLKNINVHRNRKSHKYIPYYEQLKTKKWKDFRKLVFASRGKVCEMCGAKTNLQVHHPKYVFGRKAWEYPISEVVVLCRNCHEKVHNIK